jgi:iron complex transport system substrate-binding protein
MFSLRKLLLAVGFLAAGVAEAQAGRYVSLAPATTEILFALGLDHEVAGVTTFCNYPEAAKSKPKVGTFSDPSVETILSLKPDVIFCTGLEQSPVIAKFRQLGVKVCVSDPANIGQLYDSILEIGALTGRQEQASSLVASMKQEIALVEDAVAAVPPAQRPRVFVEYWNNPLMTAGPGSFIDDILTRAGGVNIAQDTAKPFTYFSPELVIARNPQFIILAYMVGDEQSNDVYGRLGWDVIDAVKHRRVFKDFDADVLLRPGPRVALAVKELHRRLYPSHE